MAEDAVGSGASAPPEEKEEEGEVTVEDVDAVVLGADSRVVAMAEADLEGGWGTLMGLQKWEDV